MKGRLSSAQATSEEKRLRTRPVGVESKKVTGAWEKRCDWARVGQGRKASEATPREGGLGGEAQGREQESSKVFPEFRALRRGWKSLEQGGHDRGCLSLWLVGTLRLSVPLAGVPGWPPPTSVLLLLSRFSCVRLCATPQTASYQAPLSLGFSRQEY